MKIKVSGLCEVKDEHGGLYEDPAACARCRVDQDFHDYYDGDLAIQDSSAYFKAEGGELWIVVEYEIASYPNAKQLEQLSDYTQGQWSDGIGEGYEQFPQYVDGDEVYISMWHRGQQVHLEL